MQSFVKYVNMMTFLFELYPKIQELSSPKDSRNVQSLDIYFFHREATLLWVNHGLMV